MQWAWGGLSLEAGSGGDILTNVLSVKALTACERGEPPSLGLHGLDTLNRLHLLL